MTTYETTAVPGQLMPPAPLDPPAVHQLARHALDVLMPAASGPVESETRLGEAAGQLAIALCAFARLVEADADDQLAQGEDVVERLRRASLHVHEHMAATVPAAELEARTTGLVDSNLEEGLPVVGSLSAELLLSQGRSATVRLTHENAHQDVELEDGRAVRVPAADHLIVRDGLHELARLLAPLTRSAD
ncbi:hypothetical protein [Streptomyces sp. CB02115]|uniref:hypothetical protein n=1 Tax=Streptomyces sp. CB02115 TaxID=1703939 RepID=UPI00093C9361|nr:hypothetical protein [Streptomyces sp. CB02115]OKJ46753.1 hypothetical protein AMK28_37490 [Streptomyces sp. CB02115]